MRLTLPAVCAVRLVLAQSCFAAQYSYKVYYSTQSDPATGSNVAMWAEVGAGKGHDWDETMWPSTPSPTGVLLGFYNVNGTNEWDGENGWYGGTAREPVSTGTSVVIDNLYLWASTGTPSQSLQLRLQDYSWIPLGLNYKLSLLAVPSGVSYTGRTEWGIGDTSITLPFYSTANGLTGYHFQAQFTAVPEPSSILALVGGLAGLGGFALRRRSQ